MNTRRLPVVSTCVILTLLAAAAVANDQAGFLRTYCVDCHNGPEAEAKLDLSTLKWEPENRTTFTRWVKVYDKLHAGEMPPPDVPSPTAKERAAVLQSLAKQLKAADRAQQQREGRVRFRRLNRVEYEYTLRDLLKLPGLEIREVLPADAEAHGFDNVGDSLRVSYVQMARYLEAAETALDKAAWLAPEIKSYKFRLPFVDIHRFRITKDRTTIDNEAVLLRQPNTAQTPWRIDSVQIPFPGKHKIRIRGRAVTYHQEKDDKPGEGELRKPEFPHIVTFYQGTRVLGSVDLVAASTTQEITAWLEPREQIYLYVPTLDDWNPKWNKGAYTGPAVALEWIELEGPGEVSWPAASYRVLFDDLKVELWDEESGLQPPAELGDVKHHKRYPKLEFPHKKSRYMVVSPSPEEDARRLLKRFMQRAFRRPFPSDEVERYLELVRADLKKQKPFHEALLTGYKAVLSSPDFLYFLEKPGRLDDHALANRLSYFLWRSQPDETLRSLAERGVLQNDDVLREQIDRMLRDPRMERFIADFIGQWLDLRELRDTQPDEKLYPEFDDFLLESMQAETEAFFREMVQANLPTRNIVDSDFVMVNNPLADLYDLEDVQGVSLRKVTLPPQSPRGGLLTQASVLKVTANGTTTSPVVRGGWVLDRVLGTPPAPPPPNVPAVEPDTRGATTIRELLKKHRADQACASCHAKIDPPGFALESFDVIGGWRDRYRSLENGESPQTTVHGKPVRYKLGLPVDCTGQMADGRAFADIHEFKELLLEDERQIARNLTERLIVFATGAGISFADRDVVEAILDKTERDSYPLRDIIHAIVQSDLFRKK